MVAGHDTFPCSVLQHGPKIKHFLTVAYIWFIHFSFTLMCSLLLAFLKRSKAMWKEKIQINLAEKAFSFSKQYFFSPRGLEESV